VTARNALDRTWRQLAAVTGNPALRPAPLEGDIEQLPKLDFENALATLFEESPEVRSAEVGVSRSDLVVRQARAGVIPDIFARAGVHYNYERLELNQRRVGLQGSAEVAVSLPIFNRNQGVIAAARADAERAKLEVERTKLALRARLASVYREYQDAVASIERYRDVMIPRAQQAYQLYLNSFRQMAAAYPQVVITQRNLFQLQEDYVGALVSAWQRSIEIQGLLLGAGIEMDGMPAMMMGGGAMAEEGH
jgi:outer membrane protein, heavy metal efflux system